LDRIAKWLEVNSIPEFEYVEGMEAEKETLIELYEEYIAMAKELELQEILTEEEIEERKKLEGILSMMRRNE
jgi:death on curing protein